MDSPENENTLYEKHTECDDPKPTLVDASVQLDLTEDCPSEVETETIHSFQNGFTNLDMKLPIAVQNCMPINAMQVSSELVVIANNGANFLSDQKVPLTPVHTVDGSEPLRKRICIEQDGQTYILSLQDGLDGLASIVELTDKSSNGLEAAQFLVAQGNINVSAKHGINQNWFTSRADKTSLQNEGHVWKQGMWSKEEIELLESNIQQYCEEHDIPNPATIIFEMSKDERKDFYRTVAKGLNRPLFSVYRRVIRMYDNKNHVGKYTPEELDKLKQLRSIYGNDWQAIGSAMGRSASSIKDRCRLMRDNCNQGKWLPAEERRLAEAVYELANALPGEMISSGLSWAVVAERVGTRSEKQCRTKWLNYLNWKEAGGTEWTKDDDITLICRVCALNATDENHVDWTELAKGWLSVRSPQWLRGKWWSLKRHVPNGNLIPFQDVCEYLYQHFMLRVQSSEHDSSPSPVSPEDNLALQSAQILAHTKPTILQSVVPGTPPSGIVVTNVSQACPSPVVSLAGSNTIGLENGFSSVRVTPVLQALEVLPTGVQLPTTPQTFITATHAQQPINLGATLSPSQIIIHTVPAESLHVNESVPVQVDPPTQVIISAANPMTSLASTQIPSVPPSPEMVEHPSLEESEQLMGDQHYETEVIEENTDIHQVSELDDVEHETMCKNNPSSHIILSDPMLTASRSPDIGTTETRNEKHANGLDQESTSEE